MTLKTLHRLPGSALGWEIVERVDVLPFHQMGRFKWDRLGMQYMLQDTQPPTNELVEWTRERFRSAGLRAV